jgi:hypothetical protein
MHYKNGREAKPGDLVLNTESGKSGIIHSLNAGASTCNARLAVPSPNDEYVTLSNCLHVDDIKGADIPSCVRPG